METLENPELVRAGTEQFHDNGSAVKLYGVSHGGLQLHVPHQFKSADSLLGCFTWFNGAQPFSSSSFDSYVNPARVNASTTLAILEDMLATAQTIADIAPLAPATCSGSLSRLALAFAGVTVPVRPFRHECYNVSSKFFESSELSNAMRSWISPSSGLSLGIIDPRL